MNNGEGSKYTETKDLDIAELAKLVRADIKAAIKSGALPAGLKCSVKISRYSMGQSLNVSVTAFAGQIATDEFLVSNPRVFFEGARMTPEAVAVLATLEAIRRAYNFDHSDSQTDYFHVRYYGSTDFDWRFAKANREATIAARIVEKTAEVAALEARVTAHVERGAELKVAMADAQFRFDAALVNIQIPFAEHAAASGFFLGNA